MGRPERMSRADRGSWSTLSRDEEPGLRPSRSWRQTPATSASSCLLRFHAELTQPHKVQELQKQPHGYVLYREHCPPPRRCP